MSEPKRAAALALLLESFRLDLSKEVLALFERRTRRVPDELFFMAAQELVEKRTRPIVNLLGTFLEAVDKMAPAYTMKVEGERAARAIGQQGMSWAAWCEKHGKDPGKKPWEWADG